MGTLWFWIVAVMLVAYVVLDGFDIGAGIVYLFVARSEEERQQAMRSIGPFWDGNEVWLLAAGGTLFFAFPLLYASAFSGFYLPLMIVLWLLILRAISVELRGHSASRCGAPSSTRSSPSPARCWPSSMERPWPTSFAASPSARTTTSSSRSGPTGNQARIQESSTGTPSPAEFSPWSRLRSTARSISP